MALEAGVQHYLTKTGAYRQASARGCCQGLRLPWLSPCTRDSALVPLVRMCRSLGAILPCCSRLVQWAGCCRGRCSS